MCGKVMRPSFSETESNKVRSERGVAGTLPCQRKLPARANTTSVPRAVKSFRNYFDLLGPSFANLNLSIDTDSPLDVPIRFSRTRSRWRKLVRS